MKSLLSILSTLTVFSFTSSTLVSCGKQEQETVNKVGEEVDLQKLNQNLFVQLQQIIYDANDHTFKLQQNVNLTTLEVEQFPDLIRENIKWLITLNSFKISNKQRIQILNSPLDQEILDQHINNQDHQKVVTIPMIEAKKNDLAMEMMLFDNLIKDEQALIEINPTYINVIEKKFSVTIAVKPWTVIEVKVNKLLNRIKQQPLEQIINFNGYQQDWQEAKLRLKLVQHIKYNVTVEQVKQYYTLLKGQNVQFNLDYSKYALIDKFKLSSYTAKMFEELWLPDFDDKNLFIGWNQLIIDDETDAEKIKAAIIWNIKLILIKTVFAIEKEEVSTSFNNKTAIAKAQQFYISDLLFKTAITIKIDVLEEHNQFKVTIIKEQWTNIDKILEGKLLTFKTDSTIANKEYKNIIVNKVTINKIKAYYDYILEETHQFIVDFNEDLP